MQKQLARSLQGVQQTVSAFSGPQKVIALIGVAVLVLGGYAFMQWASTPSMVPLYSKVEAKDAAAITDALASKGIQYEISNGGQTISVPRGDVYKARMDLSAQGLPANSSTQGWGIFDNQPISSTKFQQEVSYQRALQGELSRSIATIDGVESAVVNLALPPKSVFADEKDSATASVVVSTQAGKTLTPGQTQSIVQLVSSGTSGMKPEGVTVLDQNGKLLSAGGSANAGMADQREAEFSANLRNKIQNILDQVAGPGKAVASVTAELSTAQKEITKKEYEKKPDIPAKNQKIRTEEYEGNGGVAAGIFGPNFQGQQIGQDNVAGPAGQAGGKNTMKVADETRNNAIDEKITNSKSHGGEVERLSVAVVIDQAAAAGVDLEALRGTVTAAAGIDAERGDIVSVQQMPFNKEAAEAAAKQLEEGKKAEEAAALMSLVKTGIIALAIIILAIVTLIIAKRRQKEDDEVEFVEEPIAVEPPPAPEPVEAPLEMPVIEGKDDVYEAMRTDITEMVDQQPEEVAELLRGWLADRRS